MSERAEEYRILFETMTQGVVYQDAAGRITSANRAAERILGLSLDQMQGRTSMDPEWRAILPNGSPHPGENHPAMVALRTRQPVLNFVQGIFNPTTHEYVWMSVDSIPQFKDGEDAPYEVVSIFSDISAQFESEAAREKAQSETRNALEESARSRRALLSVIEDQKATEAMLRETQSYLENLINNANAPIIVWDAEYRIAQFNRAFESLSGIPASRAVGRKIDVLFPEDGRAATLEYLRSTERELRNAVEIEFLGRDGDVRTLLLSSAVIYAPDGTSIAATIAQGQDITERKRAERKSIMFNERLRNLIEAIKKLSASRSMSEIHKTLVASARKLTQCDGASIIVREGDTCRYVEEDALSPLWKGKIFSLDECISGWVMKNKRYAAIPDIYADSRIPIDVYRPTFVKSLVVVPVITGESIAAISNYWSGQHAASELEIQLLQTLADSAAIAIENVLLLDDLERGVRARTAELEAANKELESFSYSVSHDLRAPLRAIDGYVRILMEEFSAMLGEEGTRLCSIISTSACKMGQLIDDLLAFSRTGKAIIEKSMIDMHAMAAGLFDEIVPETAQARIDFRIADMPPAFGDPALMRQVWSNLISNAVKFSSKTEHSKISIGSTAQNGETVYSIEDNGAGFDMRYADKLFGVFQRLHPQTEFEGTGVGLAIVQRIIHRHGGRVWAESEPGHGATFHFTLSEEANDGQSR